MSNKTAKTTYPNLLTEAQVTAKSKFTNDDFQIGAVYYVPEFVFEDTDGTKYYKLLKRTVSAATLIADQMMFAGAISNGGGSGAYDVKTLPTSVLGASTLTPATAATVTLTATVTDPDTTISKVEFYEGTTKLGQDTITPFTYAVVAITAGVHKYTARTYDTYGNVTVSNEITVTAS